MPPDQAAKDLAPDLYEQDVVLWCDRQADLLRRLRAGEPVLGQLDWDNLIDEVEAVGSSQRHAVESLLARALDHLLKIRCYPNGPVDHWTGETRGFIRGAGRSWSPSMEQLIDLPRLYADSLETVRHLKIDGALPQPVPAACPYGFPDLIVRSGDPIDVDALLAKLA